MSLSLAPWSLAPGLVIHDVSPTPCSAWTPSALLSFAARRDAQSGSRVEPRPSKGHAITERRDGVVGSKGGGHSTPRSQTMATSKPSRAPPPDCAARLPRGARDGDVRSRSLGQPRVPHPRLSGVPCPDGPSPPTASDGSGRNAQKLPLKRGVPRIQKEAEPPICLPWIVDATPTHH